MLPSHNPNAVMLTHLLTGITATCNAYRSQHANRDAAKEILMAKLWATQWLPLRDKDVRESHEFSYEFSYVFPGNVEYPNDIAEYLAK